MTAFTPFITDVRLTGLAQPHGGAIVLTYYDDRGQVAGRSVSSPDEIEAHGRDLIAAAHAARAGAQGADNVHPFGRTHSHSRLMQLQRAGDAA
jgi:hypothetical protein